MNDQAEELHDETAIVETEDGVDLPADGQDDENTEFDIVLAGQEEPIAPVAKSTSDHILNRVMKKKDKLQDENAELKRQLEQLANQQPAKAVDLPPDEYDFEDRSQYLQAKAAYDQRMLSEVVGRQLNQQQNGHRIAAQEQEQEEKLKAYAINASELKVRDFNDVQNKAFDVLGDDFAKLIAQELPEDAPKLIYYFGKNPQAAADMREQYSANPGQVTFKLGKLAGNLTIKPRESSAAQPETKVESGAVGGVATDWQAQLDKIDEGANMDNIGKTLRARREIKAKAKAAGFDVSTLR